MGRDRSVGACNRSRATDLNNKHSSSCESSDIHYQLRIPIAIEMCQEDRMHGQVSVLAFINYQLSSSARRIAS